MKNFLFISIVVLVAVYAVYNILNLKFEEKTLKNHLDIWGISLEGSERFFIKGSKVDEIKNLKMYEIHASNQNQTIFVKRFLNFDVDFQKNYFSDKTAELNFLFEPSPAPYPGVITRTIVCPDEFKPLVSERDNSSMKSITYVMYSNDRFAYGICSKDLIKYRSVFSLVYCKLKNEIYEIEYFKPVEEFVQEDVNRIQNFKCN